MNDVFVCIILKERGQGLISDTVRGVIMQTLDKMGKNVLFIMA